MGLELMGRAFDEATLISIAAGYEAHTDHRRLLSTTPPLDVAPYADCGDPGRASATKPVRAGAKGVLWLLTENAVRATMPFIALVAASLRLDPRPVHLLCRVAR